MLPRFKAGFIWRGEQQWSARSTSARRPTQRAAGTPYEIQIYSGAPHGFTEFGSDRYQERADQESWQAFADFLADQFGSS